VGRWTILCRWRSRSPHWLERFTHGLRTGRAKEPPLPPFRKGGRRRGERASPGSIADALVAMLDVWERRSGERASPGSIADALVAMLDVWGTRSGERASPGSPPCEGGAGGGALRLSRMRNPIVNRSSTDPGSASPNARRKRTDRSLVDRDRAQPGTRIDERFKQYRQ
jgi:hypothetical protein